MILDKVFHGVLDQGRGCLLVFDEAEADVSFPSSPHSFPPLSTMISNPSQNTYGAAIGTLEQVGKVVDSLYAKVRCSSVLVLWSDSHDCARIDSQNCLGIEFIADFDDALWLSDLTS